MSNRNLIYWHRDLLCKKLFGSKCTANAKKDAGDPTLKDFVPGFR